MRMTLTLGMVSVGMALPGSAAETTGSATGAWWLEKPVRLIQTNLREIDAIDFDVDRYCRDIEAAGANAALINVGGIVANYPTELPYQYANPNLRSDMIGEVIEQLHGKGIRVIGRFDFSKLNETLAKDKPEWLYISPKGDNVNYNGQIHTCVNGGYQQEYLFKILGEAIDRYDLDGIFFNMIGYQTRDYSGNYHGICQSDACKKRFGEWSGGMTLPTKEDGDDSVFRRYQQFKGETSNDLFHRVNAFIKEKDPAICICTYTHAGVDLIRKESGSHLGEGPAWEFHSTENVKLALGSHRDKQVSNAAVHFVAIPYRHASVSPNLTGMRLVEDMLSGGGLDFYCIGRLDNQEDRAALDVVRDIFGFHKKHVSYFTGLVSDAEVCLVRGPRQERRAFQGFVRMLAENHILFDCMEDWRLEHADTPRRLEDYKLLILPNTRRMSSSTCERIDRYVENGGLVLATGYTSTQDGAGEPLNRIRLVSSGLDPAYKVQKQARASYVRITPDDKKQLPSTDFSDLDLVYLHSDFLECSPQGDARGLLSLIRPAMFGPPEKCYYTDDDITAIPAMTVNTHGMGRFVFVPWQVGAQYAAKAHHGFSLLTMGAIRDLLGFRQGLEVDASPLVEVTHQVSEYGAFSWYGLANHSGQIGSAFHAAVPLHDVTLRLPPGVHVADARLLRSGKTVPVQRDADGRSMVTVPELGLFEMVVLER